MKKGKQIAAFFHRSSKASSLLEKECKARGVQYYRLVQCVVTRWNSLYFMMNRIRKCHKSINFVLVSLKSALDMLYDEDLEIIDDMLQCLRPFADITTEFSGEKYTTMSLVIPNVNILLSELRTMDTEMKTEAGRMLLEGLIERTEERLLKYETRTVSM